MWLVSHRSLWQVVLAASMAAILTGIGAPAAEPPKPSAPAASVERHSPSDGYPSLGPAKAKNTLVFFTDYQ